MGVSLINKLTFRTLLADEDDFLMALSLPESPSVQSSLNKPPHKGAFVGVVSRPEACLCCMKIIRGRAKPNELSSVRFLAAQIKVNNP